MILKNLQVSAACCCFHRGAKECRGSSGVQDTPVALSGLGQEPSSLLGQAERSQSEQEDQNKGAEGGLGSWKTSTQNVQSGNHWAAGHRNENACSSRAKGRPFNVLREQCQSPQKEENPKEQGTDVSRSVTALHSTHLTQELLVNSQNKADFLLLF